MYISEISHTKSEKLKTELQEKVYDTLEKLEIPYSRVDTETVITMEDCIAVDQKLDMEMVTTSSL